MNYISTIFEKSGYAILAEQSTSARDKTTLLYMNNPDGSIRWIWPASMEQPQFLKFYSVLGYKSKIFASLIKIIFRIGLQKYTFKKYPITYNKCTSSEPLFPMDSEWAIFTGTVGPNRKAVLYTESSGTKIFTKIPIGENASNLLLNEAQTIDWLTEKDFTSFEHPKHLKTALPVLQLSDISGEATRQVDFGEIHLAALTEIIQKSVKVQTITQIPSWNEAIQDLEFLKNANDSRIPKGIFKKLSLLIDSIDDSRIVQTTFSHCDFTSWNMFEGNGKLHIYDWELAKQSMPKGFDAFHFMCQQGILVARKPWKNIEAEIFSKLGNSLFAKESGKLESEIKIYLKLYLILNTIYYLKIYHLQTAWHTQITWLLNTWNDAISSMIADKKTNRLLVLADMFDYIHQEKYATLKFGQINPDELSIFSDVDLCMHKKTAVPLLQYLANHCLVKQHQIKIKTYMASASFVCNDNSILSIDLIWEFKRNATVMMEMEAVLTNAFSNEYGIKEPTKEDTARYVGLFYALNNAKIPEKYIFMGDALSNCITKLDQALFGYFKNEEKSNSEINALVNRNPINRGFSKIKNMLSYLKDTLKGIVSHRGVVITFSGVDGAGKSTIIENIKYRIEKQLRRKVVVIRHRPSILPILSAWTKGKEEAERQAAATLPRQGKNKNTLSSFARFAYYYSDYIFGQFIIYFKYTLRGYVILYDRYYFDFINDSRRSNLQLPYAITRFGYRFVMKPDFNFFLYADVALILSRKQELDAASITELTTKYLRLFDDLNKNNPKAKYMPIENIDLEETLKIIMDTIASKTI